MGLVSNVKNTINGKKYLISTALVNEHRWETAVFERNLFGFPKMSHPLMLVSASNEHQAQSLHSQVEKIVAQINPAEWNSPEWTPTQDQFDAAPSPVATTEDSSQLWVYFRGKLNTKPVLEEKANMLLKLTIDQINNTYELIMVHVSHIYGRPEIRTGEDESWRTYAEIGALILCLINPIAFKFLGSKNRDVFMCILDAGVTSALESKGVAPEYFHVLIHKRIVEYANYEWLSEKEFWEFGNKITTILNLGPDPLLKALITSGLLNAFMLWQLNDLLRD